MRIAVVGLGKIGLPLAVQFASKGHSVVGVDTNPVTVHKINEGNAPFPNEQGLEELLRVQVLSRGLVASIETSASVARSEVVVIVVPLVVDGNFNPDFSAIDSATREVARGLRPGTLVSYETTLPVGTTRNHLLPLLEQVSGLAIDRDFHLVFSPERVFSGRVFSDLRSYPKLVGGVSSDSENRGIGFYASVLDFDERQDLPRANGVWGMGTAEAAELSKLAETTYRDVNIGLANQFATFAENNGINFDTVIQACNSQPFSHIHAPGIAVGGHCIPVYPHLYLQSDPTASIVRAAREVNSNMPHQAVIRLTHELGSLRNLRVAVLGAAYRGGVKETAFSGVYDLVKSIKRQGALPLVHDPLYTNVEITGLGLEPYERGSEVDAVILQADHTEYKLWSIADCPGAKVVLDGRGTLDPDRWSQGCRLVRLGSPSATPRI